MHEISAQEVIEYSAMFRHVSPQQKAEVVRTARLEFARRGAVVAHRGERLGRLLTVGRGMVKLALQNQAGKEKVLRLVGQGESFGEAVLFLEHPVPVNAVAVVDTALVAVPATALLQLVDQDPRFARALLAGLAQRVHALVCDFEAATLHGATGRAAAYLDSLAPVGTAPLAVRLPASKTLVATRLGMTKETFSRVLRELCDTGLVTMRNREISLLDRAGLQRLALGLEASAGS